MRAAVGLTDGLGLDGDRCIRVIPRQGVISLQNELNLNNLIHIKLRSSNFMILQGSPCISALFGFYPRSAIGNFHTKLEAKYKLKHILLSNQPIPCPPGSNT